ncbi:uncharacterized protein BP5553_05930 [Venustampulla echinocandica]|uniref:Uncharacterized protein n=1 Tax=Venustampulla echinocandica TaxID=2656787 RepID=A0A370TM28_9HELO|nr:uncharacterized protein BP5553_05930 [Venustampulla echinocandica]RDL36578.1 hypothetical protein BP5553_05930 [Venustampulla echinocandica]
MLARGYDAAAVYNRICQLLQIENSIRNEQNWSGEGHRGTPGKPWAVTAPAATAGHQADMGGQNGGRLPLLVDDEKLGVRDCEDGSGRWNQIIRRRGSEYGGRGQFLEDVRPERGEASVAGRADRMDTQLPPTTIANGQPPTANPPTARDQPEDSIRK